MTSARPQPLKPTNRRRRGRRLVLPAVTALALTTTVVGVSVGAAAPQPEPVTHAAPVSAEIHRAIVEEDLVEVAEDRSQRVSRSVPRVTLQGVPEPVGHRFATAPLKIRVQPTESSRALKVVGFATRLAITGEQKRGFAEIAVGERPYWVSAEYLAKSKPQPPKPMSEPEPQPSSESTPAPRPEPASDPAPRRAGGERGGGGGKPAPDPAPKPKPKPKPAPEPKPKPKPAPAPEPAGLSSAPCPNSSSIESGITSDAVRVYRAVCAEFPMISTYGGYRGDGEHADGTSVDVMVSGGLGYQVRDFLLAHAGELGLYDIIYSQRIWTAQRSSEGWRYMGDRGSATANHYDHVHVKVFG